MREANTNSRALLPYLPVCLVGASAALAPPSFGKLKNPVLAICAIWLVILGTSPALWSGIIDVETIHSAGFFYAIASAAIIIISRGHDGLQRLIGCAPLAWIGKCSFSIYLLHMFGHTWAIAYLPNWAVGVVTLLLALAISSLTYLGIERSGISLGEWLIRSSRRLVKPANVSISAPAGK